MLELAYNVWNMFTDTMLGSILYEVAHETPRYDTLSFKLLLCLCNYHCRMVMMLGMTVSLRIFYFSAEWNRLVSDGG